MSRSRIEDVLDVLKAMEDKFIDSGKTARISELRQYAINEIAHHELKSNRFKNKDSAEKSIHDACTRRLRKINDIYNFEHAAKDWLNGNSNPIIRALEFEIRTSHERLLIDKFFGQSVSNEEIQIEEKIITKLKPLISTPIASDIEEPGHPERMKQETYRILRDTNLARNLKIEKQFKCEICQKTLHLGLDRPYAEVHHIKPLGSPHNGPDIRDNILCVCPNCHVLLDYGAIMLDAEKFKDINSDYIEYHNTLIYKRS
tara:strand:- start:7609 stop:8382 length:774 start_codon:yes stop_codon:yes gene_type:complete